VAEADEPVKIVYPGRPNDDRGADLRDAVISTGRGLCKGDIEIHANSSGWRAHRHHEDPAYNRVVLHVVYRHDTGEKTILQNGLDIPVLALDKYAEEQANHRVTSAFSPIASPCCRAGPELISRFLDAAGDARFNSRVTHYLQEITAAGPGQALYAGIMTALGYSKNKAPMAELARAVPLRELESFTARAEPDSNCLARLQARLLGVAGLLPSQRNIKRPPENPPGEYEIILEELWEKHGSPARMHFTDWHFFKVRPGNFPTRRIAAMSYLLVRHGQKGLPEGFKAFLEAAAPDNGRCLEESLLVSADGYWNRYMDFGLRLKRRLPALVGRDRAAEIIVNVLLPFFAAYARVTAQPEPAAKALNIFQLYRMPSGNSLEKHMAQQMGIPPAAAATARRRQGLIHIYKTLCTQGKCGECPLHG